MTRRAGLLAALTVLVVALLTVAAGGPAAAHAQLLSTDPADGTVLGTAPAAVTLTFNEPVRLVEDAVRVLDPAGAEVEVTTRAVDTDVVAELSAELPDGTYVVSWRVVSADSHPIDGAFTFSVGAPSDTTADVAADEEDRGVTVATMVAQAAAYLGLLAAAGLIVFRVALLPAPHHRTAGARRLHGLALGGAVLAMVGLLAALPLAGARETGDGLGALAGADAWSGRLAADPGLAAGLAAAGLTIGLATARRPRPGPAWSALALLGAGVAVGAPALVGHTRTYGPGWLVVSSDLLHVACGAVWLGGLIGLWIVLRDADADPVGAGVVVARFSAVAAVLVAALSVAGVVLGWRIIGSWSNLFGTTYGAALLVKAGLAGVVVAVAGYNRYRLLPRLARTPSWPVLRRTVGVEAAVLVAILALTGFLVEQNPRGEPVAEAPAVVAARGQLGDGRVDLTLTPGARGDNTLRFELTDAAGAPLVPHHPPTVRLSQPATELGPFEHTVTETAPGAYEATVNVPLSGEWIVEVAVRVSEFDEPIAGITVEVR
ncbi:FixH family protein [Jiangella ureilytica]|uniref:copper resistance CopC/CopD family protein n=1 Tax=Jiangella ureilytica TaxID=2530374 RepID=UPI0013A5E0F5|nr:FixH family protein [Jiangella ureilytica]